MANNVDESLKEFNNFLHTKVASGGSLQIPEFQYSSDLGLVYFPYR